VLVKSMLASKNLQKPITRIQDGGHWIRVLAAELHLRLRDAQETFPGLWPKSLVRCFIVAEQLRLIHVLVINTGLARSRG
jgi:hypothetical protein